MNWQEVCEHPDLQNLPFKIELNEIGQILMSPAKVYHSVFQGEIAALLRMNRTDGKILTECAINTPKGTKVADVAWASPEAFKQIKDETECSIFTGSLYRNSFFYQDEFRNRREKGFILCQRCQRSLDL